MYYLSLNEGAITSDSLITDFGGLTVDKVVMDVLIKNPQPNTYGFLLGPTNIRVSGGALQFPTGVTGFAFGARTTMTIDIVANYGSAISIASIFYRSTGGSGYNGYAAAGHVYDVKYYSSGVLVAHYDMSTQTVQDQSGNGHNATLTGGSWVDGPVYHLQANGTSDFVKMPSMTFDKIVMDMTSRAANSTIYLDSRSGFGTGYLQKTGTGQDNWGTSISGVKVNGVSKTNGTSFIPYNTRATVEIDFAAAGADDVNIFSNSGGTGSFVAGDLYDIKFYNGATLVAHYDMTTGNVTDKTGNGYNATLTGGTWITDGSGGTNTPFDLSGTSAGSSSVSASLTQLSIIELSGASAGSSAATADPIFPTLASGSSSGSSSVSANVGSAYIISASSAGSSTASAVLALPTLATGQASGQSIATAYPLFPALLSGMSAGKSSASAAPLFPSLLSGWSAGISDVVYEAPLEAVKPIYLFGSVPGPVEIKGSVHGSVSIKGGSSMTITGQDFSRYAGDTIPIELTIYKSDGVTPEDLTGASVKWILKKYSVLITKDTASGGVTITDPSNGKVEITLDPADTISLQGVYSHSVIRTDRNGSVKTVTRGDAIFIV